MFLLTPISCSKDENHCQVFGKEILLRSIIAVSDDSTPSFSSDSFFFSITLHSMRIGSFRCPYFPVGWESQPDRYDAVRFQFPFRYLLRRIGRHALFSSDGLSFRGRQLSLQVRYRTILTIHTLMINLANSSISNYIQRK